MIEMDQMVMLYLVAKRRINLVRLILDFILAVVNTERRRHATLPYGMFLTRVFIGAQLPLDGHKADNKRPTTTMKTFSALGEINAEKVKSKPSGEEKKKRKREKRSLSLIPGERKTSKRRIMKVTEESSFSSRAEDESLQLV